MVKLNIIMSHKSEGETNNMLQEAFSLNYTPYVDICTIAFCFVYIILMRSTFTFKDGNLKLFKFTNILVLIAAACGPAYQLFADNISSSNWILILAFKICKDLALGLALVAFCIYISNICQIGMKQRQYVMIISWILYSIYAFWILSSQMLKVGFYIDDNYVIHEGNYLDAFEITYFLFAILMVAIIKKSRRKFVAKIRYCLSNIFGLSLIVMLTQMLFKQTSFTCLVFSFPMVAVLFLFHYNAYDRKTGMLDDRAFEAYINQLGSKNYTLLCLDLHNLGMVKLENLSEEFYHFAEDYFVGLMMFRLSDNQIIMLYEDVDNLDAVLICPKLVQTMKELFGKYKIDFHLTMIHSSPEFATSEEYVAFWDFVDSKSVNNGIYESDRDDVKEFLKADYIIRELKDIYTKKDLHDPRVLTYCQPVLNTATETFTSAEALMRLKLDEIGMVYPDVFIPLAEKYDYIHILSLIILNKTCKQVRTLLDQGYEITRVSVNFAMSELKDANFCDEILQIIKDNNIPYEKIAVELTESMNDFEFVNVKKIMSVLHDVGMKFYLDDFGTGYSNIERIIKLPIDIIKFDRSLTIMAGMDENSKHMVEGFTNIFNKSEYNILFEGIETEVDEVQCKNMNAKYLQGYRYSRPIPIEELCGFLVKSVS